MASESAAQFSMSRSSVEGQRATVIDLYELAARDRSLAAHLLPLTERVSLARSVMPDVWPGWTTTEGSERSGDLIEVVDYGDAWPARFERWRQLLWSALGEIAERIEHVGSTSAPDLVAKPIVDVQVSVADLDDEAASVPPIEAVGAAAAQPDELHRYFRPFRAAPRDIHVHVCHVGSACKLEHLLFRDYLREHAESRDAPSRAKRAAAMGRRRLRLHRRQNRGHSADIRGGGVNPTGVTNQADGASMLRMRERSRIALADALAHTRLST